MTGFRAHLEQWKDCTKCALSKCRTRMVFARGTVPCDVVFVGEAPGESEDVTGLPFIGPAGKLFDAILSDALPEGVTYAITNLVCCMPRDEDGMKISEPEPEYIMACAPRLREFIKLCNPKLVVCVGDLAAVYIIEDGKKPFLPGYTGKKAQIVHPAAILRANDAQKGLMTRRTVIKLANAVGELQ